MCMYIYIYIYTHITLKQHIEVLSTHLHEMIVKRLRKAVKRFEPPRRSGGYDEPVEIKQTSK